MMEYRCSVCGTYFNDRHDFCPNCGTKLVFKDHSKAIVSKASNSSLLLGIFSLVSALMSILGVVVMVVLALPLIPVALAFTIITLGLGLFFVIPLAISYILLTIFMPIVASVAGIILGISCIASSKKKNQNVKTKTPALIMGIIGLVISILVIVVLVGAIVTYLLLAGLGILTPLPAQSILFIL